MIIKKWCIRIYCCIHWCIELYLQ